MTSRIIYQGDLRTTSTHIASGDMITTDAPVDNNGKGGAFSPTDLVANALGSCMLTIMGIAAHTHHIDITGTEVSITKVMADNPRRIARIVVSMKMQGQAHYDDKQQKILELAARTCPVALSLHPDIVQELSFIW